MVRCRMTKSSSWAFAVITGTMRLVENALVTTLLGAVWGEDERPKRP